MVILATYATIEYWTAIPKVIEISMFWYLAIKIYRSQKTKLNLTYCISFFVWTLYTMSDLIMWISAANSPTWFFIANRIRDVQVVVAVVFAFLIYFSTEIIVKGYNGLNWKRIWIIAAIFFVDAILVAVVDRLNVYDVNGTLLAPEQWNQVEMVVVNPNITLITMALMGFPLLLYILSVVELIRLIRRNVDDKELKRRMYSLIVGIILIPSGVLYFAFVLGIPGMYNIMMIIIGRTLWILAPIFIWRSQQKK